MNELPQEEWSADKFNRASDWNIEEAVEQPKETDNKE